MTVKRFLLAGFLCFTTCAAFADDEPIVVRLRLPVQSELMGKSSAGKWYLAAPVVDEFSDPNQIVYDEAHFDAYVSWAVDAPIACGAATYKILVDGRIVECFSGLDESYLGRQFRADDLVRFLKARVDGKSVEREFQVKRAEAVKMLREGRKSTSLRRLMGDPWARDTRTVISLLALAKHKPAHPLFRSLLKDESKSVRIAALWGLGRIAPAAPEAVDDIVKMLSDKELHSEAGYSLSLAGPAAIPAMTNALDHPDEMARNHVVHALGSISPAEAAQPALMAALEHSDKEIRYWAASVVADMISRHTDKSFSQPYLDVLVKRLDDEYSNARYSAALALSSMGPLAASAEQALEQTLKEDSDSSVRTMAEYALKVIRAEQDESEQWPAQ